MGRTLATEQQSQTADGGQKPEQNTHRHTNDAQTSFYKTLFTASITFSECLKRWFPLGRHLGALLLLVSEPATERRQLHYGATMFSYWSQLMVTNGSVFFRHRALRTPDTPAAFAEATFSPLIKNLLNATHNANH